VTAPVIVVGAGAAGLGAATALAERGPVMIVDRIPVAGGAAHYERSDVRAWAASATRAGARFVLGATAIRWQDHRLLVCAPGDIRRHPAALLVFAGGRRPATAAELGLAGDRPAGVLPVSVAKHLLESSADLWRRVAIVGDAPAAADAAALIAAGGGTVVRVDHDAASPPPALSIVGRDHVSALRIERNGTGELVPCDAVLLATDDRPVRNVEGAIADDADAVVYLQDLPGPTFDQTARDAQARAREIVVPDTLEEAL
jgi:glycine/D-amino acid oxidase-like deaminating enzyme